MTADRQKTKYILVDNSKALDVPTIRPLIKGKKLKLKRIVERDIGLGVLYVVEHLKDEVYLSRSEFKFITEKQFKTEQP